MTVRMPLPGEEYSADSPFASQEAEAWVAREMSGYLNNMDYSGDRVLYFRLLKSAFLSGAEAMAGWSMEAGAQAGISPRLTIGGHPVSIKALRDLYSQYRQSCQLHDQIEGTVAEQAAILERNFDALIEAIEKVFLDPDTPPGG